MHSPCGVLGWFDCSNADVGAATLWQMPRHIHRTNSDIPEDLIDGLAELGVFGLSAPVEYGGFAEGGASDYLGMVVATEELSREAWVSVVR